jgi:DNA-binding transcriptional regulator YhcF (GntR family)
MKNEKTTTFKNRILNSINDQMSKEIKRSKQIKATDKLILSTIMSWERQDKECWMSTKSMAEENGLGTATVDRCISNLKKLGIVEITYKQQYGKELHIISINYNGLERLLNKEEKETIQPQENNITTNQQTQETMIVKVNTLASQAAQDWAIELNNCEAEEDFVETIVEEQPIQPTKFEDDGTLYNNYVDVYNIIKNYGSYDYASAEKIMSDFKEFELTLTKTNILKYGLLVEVA